MSGRIGRSVSGRIAVVAILAAPATSTAVAQTVTGGAREIILLNFASMPVGDFPKRRDLSTQSSLEVVDRNGVHMLKAATPSDFLISLPETLPQTFTLEFDLVPQECCGADDLSFEGTRSKSPGNTSSAEVFWSPSQQRVYGGGVAFRAATASLQQKVSGQLSRILASFDGTTLKLYTNDERLYTVSDVRFVRGQVLRVSLNGTDEVKGAVYLARVRIAEGTATVTQIAAASGGSIGFANAQQPSGTALVTAASPAPPAVAAPPPSWTSGVTRTGATTALAPPTRLAAEGTPAMATLMWLAPTEWTPTGYTVVRNISGTAESLLLTSAPITTTRYEDRSGFGAGKTYEYVVTALSTDPKAFGSAQTSFLPPPPQNVSNVAASVQGGNVTVSWTGVPGASKYFIASSVEALAREVPASETVTTYSGIAPGSYSWAVGARYEPGPIETPAASWPSVTMVLLAPRAITQGALRAAGGFGPLGPLSMTLPALDAVGGLPSLAPRAITLPSLIAAGASATYAPPLITLSGLSATGGFVSLAPRIITLSGLAAAGGSVSLSPRTITLPGLSVAGLTSVP